MSLRREKIILTCQSVTKQFGELAAVDNLSFNVAEGEVFGIAGPNGSGKTTTFNLITGVYPFSGEILFQNERIHGLSPYRICHKGIARTFQIPHLFSSLTVRDNIRAGAHFGVTGTGDEKENISQVIDFVGLGGKENIIAANLKLLDKKRTMIATALATKPKLLLLDEPIAGLSPKEIRESVEMFKRINQELGLTIMIIEHFMKVMTELSHRLMILESGRRICLSDPSEVSQDERVIKCYLGERHA